MHHVTSQQDPTRVCKLRNLQPDPHNITDINNSKTFPTIFTLLKTRLTVCITFLLCQVMTCWHAELGHRMFYLVKLDCPAWHKRKRPSTSLHDHAACYYYHTSQTQHQPTWPYCMLLLQHKPKLHRSSFKLVIFTAYLSAANTQTIAVWHWSLSTACTVASHSCVTVEKFCS